MGSKMGTAVQVLGLLVVLAGVFLAGGAVPTLIVGGAMLLTAGVLVEVFAPAPAKPITRDDHERIV